MSYILPLLASIGSANEAHCDFRVQIAHVQDVTSTFREEIQMLKEQNLVQKLIQDLQKDYKYVDYAITTFGDKPMPITGSAQNSGWHAEWPEHVTPDSCYDMISPMTSDVQVSGSAFNSVDASGGKDFMENQWDALRKTALDSTVGWDLRDYDDNGSPIVRVAVLVTDDAAHTAPETFQDQPRNLNREYWKLEGPFDTYSQSGSRFVTQECDLDATLEASSNILTSYRPGSSSTQTPLVNGGVCWGFTTPKAGALRSLKGSLAYMNYFYGFGETTRLVDLFEGDNCPLDSNCFKYQAFVNCCTAWGTSIGRLCPVDSHYNSLFPDFDTCADFGGKYARCHYTQEGKYGILNEPPSARHMACTEQTEEYLAVKNKEPVPEFFEGLGIASDSQRDQFLDLARNVVPYPYDESIFEKDCRSYEYPDPKSAAYAKAFVDRDIIPVIVAAPPATQVLLPGGHAGQVGAYDYHALRMSEMNCPNLEHDPWTTMFCRYSNTPDWYCYQPHAYPALYPTMSTWEDQRFYLSDGCSTPECAKKWWSRCMNVEYGEPIEQMKSHGATAYYQEMDAEYDADLIIKTIKEVVARAMEAKGCIIPSTEEPSATEAPEVVTTVPVIIPPVVETTTKAPVVETTTKAPAVTTTTKAPVVTTTTKAPVVTTTTKAPVVTTTTKAPVITTTTKAPVITTTTKAPVVTTTTTKAPVVDTTTKAPVVTTTTKAPDVETTTKAPDVETTTKAPVVETTTKAPVVDTTTKAPVDTTSQSDTTAAVVTDVPPTAPPTQAPAETEEEDSNAGVVIGSAIGGVVAAGGAVAAALMAKGVIPMGGGGSAAQAPMEDVDVIDMVNEREQIAEVGDMFV